MRPLSSAAFNRRRDDLYARLDRLGRLDLQDLGSNRPLRKLVADLHVPGQEDDAQLRDEARFRYEEWWRPSRFGWLRTRYDYGYFDLGTGARRGYHLHALRGRDPVPHAVCVLAGGQGEGQHFEAHEIDLLAAHEEFEAQYAAARPIDCRGLRRIN